RLLELAAPLFAAPGIAGGEEQDPVADASERHHAAEAPRPADRRHQGRISTVAAAHGAHAVAVDRVAGQHLRQRRVDVVLDQRAIAALAGLAELAAEAFR